MELENTAKAYLKGEWGKTPGGFQCRVALFEDGPYYGFDGTDWDLEVLRRRVRNEKPFEKKKVVTEHWSEEQEEQSLDRSRRRLKAAIRRSGDVLYKLLTLTWETVPVVRLEAYRHFSEMCRRFHARVGQPLDYISSLDVSAQGRRWHYHVLIIAPYVDQKVWQDELWKKGIVDIRKTWKITDEQGLHSMCNYMNKYMCKKQTSHVRGLHRFNVSENFPDVAEDFRVFVNTHEEAHGLVEDIAMAFEPSIRSFTFATVDDKLITILSCFNPGGEEGNPLKRLLTGLANKPGRLLAKGALHPQNPQPILKAGIEDSYVPVTPEPSLNPCIPNLF